MAMLQQDSLQNLPQQIALTKSFINKIRHIIPYPSTFQVKLAYTDTFRNNKWTTKNLRADERINFLLNYQEEQQYIEKQERNLETLKKEVNEDRLKKIRIDKESITKDKELELD